MQPAMQAGRLLGAIITMGIVALFGAIILRAAVAAVNRILGPQTVPNDGQTLASQEVTEELLTDSTAYDSANPYSPPMHSATATGSTATTLAVAEPSYGRALAICTVIGLFSVFINFGLELAGAPRSVLALIKLPANFVIGSIVFKLMIPTSFGKAMLVYLLYGLIAIAILAVIAGLGFLVFSFA